MADARRSFHILTKTCQMSFRVTPEKHLLLSYFGTRLNDPNEAFTAPPAETVAYPTERDARSVRENHSGEYAVDVVQADGMRSLDLRFECYECKNISDGRIKHSFVLTDSAYSVAVRHSITANAPENVFEEEITVINKGNKAILLQRADSGCLRMHAEQYNITTFRGCWAGESRMHEEALQYGNTLCVASSSGTKAAQEGTPGFVLALDEAAREETGRVVLGALAWSGNYSLSFKHAIDHTLFLRGGISLEGAPYRLNRGKEFTTPRLLLTFSNEGKGEASRNLHRWARKCGIRHGEAERAIVLNSWEAVYFDVNEPVLYDLIAKAGEIGAEVFVLDDGWFGSAYPRDRDTAGLGDWVVNRKKLPHGIEGLEQATAVAGLRLGLWIEPEMVNPYSELFVKHPEWVLQLPNRKLTEERNQFVLDLANPAVRQYILRTVDRLLTQHPGITYIKWDCNRKVTETGSAQPHYNQNNLFVDYVRGYEEIISELTTLHPRVTFQACSAGGGRADYGTLLRHDEFWVSDNTDPVSRLFMQWGVGHFFPSLSMGAHITASPNHQTGRETPLKFRIDTAMSARLGLEWDLRCLSDGERNALRHALNVYKELRPIIHQGDLWRIKSPIDGRSCSLLYHSTESGKECAVLFAWQWGLDYTERDERLMLPALSADKKFLAEEICPDETGFRSPLAGRILSGDYLANAGLPLRWNRPLQSAVWRLTEQP